MRLITLALMASSTVACGASEKKGDTTIETSVETLEEVDAAAEVEPETVEVEAIDDTQLDTIDSEVRA